MVGSVLARNLKVGVGDEVTLLGSGLDGSFAAAVANVSGIFDSGVADLDRSVAAIPIGFFDDVFFMQGAAHSIVVVTPELSQVDRYRAELAAFLPDDNSIVVQDWNALQPGLRQAIQADLGSAFFHVWRTGGTGCIQCHEHAIDVGSGTHS